MTSAEIIKLLDILVGRVEAAGNKFADEQIEKDWRFDDDQTRNC